MYFNGNICVITGSGSGIGRALALGLGSRGATVIASDIHETNVKETAALVNEAGPGKAIAEAIDVSNEDAVSLHINRVADQYGRIDLIINNAGIAITGEARDLSIEHWRRVINVNLMGVLYGSDTAYKIMTCQGFGHIVNISSLSGLVPFPTNIPYGTTKYAIVGLTAGLRAEGEALGVKVSIVCPGFIESNIYTSSEAVNVSKENLTDILPFRMVPVHKAAEKILKGIERNDAVIIFPGYAKFIWWLHRINARLTARTSRRLITDFRKLRNNHD